MTPGASAFAMRALPPPSGSFGDMLHTVITGTGEPPGSIAVLFFTPEAATQRYRVTCTVDAMQTYNVRVYAIVDTRALALFDGTQLAPSGTLAIDYDGMTPVPSFVSIAITSTVNWNFGGCEGTRL